MDQKKAEQFSKQLLEVANHAAISLMISIGHRTGLFDHMADMPAATSKEIAQKCHLNERYVREWLGAMVTGNIVQFNPEKKTYSFPEEHAAFLTRKASPNNIAVTVQFIPVLAQVEEEIVKCFKNGGGVSYSSYPRFHQVMAEESHQTVVLPLVEHILPLVSGLTEALKAGIEVMDVGCGSGKALVQMAKYFPKSRFIGYDFSKEGIQKANENAQEKGLQNISFEVKDVSTIGDKNRFDLITAFDAIHDQAKPREVLKHIFNALKPDGTFLMQDIAGSSHVQKNMDHPVGPFLYTISCMHCMTVSLADQGEGLGAMWGEEKAKELLKEAGFNHVEVKQLPHDFINYFYIIKK